MEVPGNSGTVRTRRHDPLQVEILFPQGLWAVLVSRTQLRTTVRLLVASL